MIRPISSTPHHPIPVIFGKTCCTSELPITEIECCPKCGWMGVLDKISQAKVVGKRCMHCWHWWPETDKPVYYNDWRKNHAG